MIDLKNHGIKDSGLLRVVDPQAANKMVIQVNNAIRSIPDHPHNGCIYRDITTLLKDQTAFKTSIMGMFILGKNDLGGDTINKIVAIESRGWIYGAILADRLNLPLVIARKHGLLPAGTATQGYGDEDKLMRIHRDAIAPGDRVLIVDDMIITGKSTLAVARCVEKLGGKIVKIIALMDLDGRKGRERLAGNGYKVATVISYSGK